MRVKLTIAYDGTGYLGWQENRMGPTVEKELQAVIEQICQHPVKLEAASRTDSGVHALGQVVVCDLERPVAQHSLNRLLPPAIRVCRVEEVEKSFHPSLDAKGKVYHYRVCLGPYQMPQRRLHSWHCHRKVDLAKMAQIAKSWTGKGDFSSFCNRGHSHHSMECDLKRMDLIEEEGGVRIEMEADRFLFRMARNLVGTLFYDGDRKVTAPAHGLTLVRVDYDR